MKYFFIILILNYCISSSAQFTDRYWAFGDSAAIDFKNPTLPVPSTSVLRARGTCASICDSLGNLIFYAASANIDTWLNTNSDGHGFIINSNNNIVSNGDSLRTKGWYQEIVIVPNPGDTNQFYVFQAGVTSTPIPGFSYSLVDMSLNNGLGYVVQKNVQLITNPVCDAITAVKHGNGRDWWVIMRPWNSSVPVNSYYVYLISPNGISNPIIQQIGHPVINSSIACMKYNRNGNHLYFANSSNVIERYDFNRCTGQLSNLLTIYPYIVIATTYLYWGMEISPDESKLYLTSIYQGQNQDSSFLYQFDLNAPNIYASKDTLAIFVKINNEGVVAGRLQLGSDNKIYLSNSYENNDCGFFYLYCDTSSFFNENMNLSVINSPDSLGTACDFQPYSFYLGGHRTYVGLPNNPNYELNKLSGSPCDTLGNVGIDENERDKTKLFVYYDKEWQKAFINAQALKGNTAVLRVYDIQGKLIFSTTQQLFGGYFNYNLPMQSFEDGVYIIVVENEQSRQGCKLVKH